MTTEIEISLPVSVLTKSQTRTYGPVEYVEHGQTFRITAKVRYDDKCNNGHNSFSVTADIERKSDHGRWSDHSGGCCHDEVVKHFPELAPFIKWHLTSSDGPMHYLGNVVYHAGDKDCHGLRKGEVRQLRNGRTGKLCWILESSDKLEKYVDADEKPTGTLTLNYVPWNRVGEGKERQLDFARSGAVWPDATDEELTAPGLEQRLMERLPALMAEFKQAMESLGFTY